jgi:hypothetical protein
MKNITLFFIGMIFSSFCLPVSAVELNKNINSDAVSSFNLKGDLTSNFLDCSIISSLYGDSKQELRFLSAARKYHWMYFFSTPNSKDSTETKKTKEDESFMYAFGFEKGSIMSSLQDHYALKDNAQMKSIYLGMGCDKWNKVSFTVTLFYYLLLHGSVMRQPSVHS